MLSPTKRILWFIKNIIKIIKSKSSANCFVVNFKNEVIKILNKNSEILLKKMKPIYMH